MASFWNSSKYMPSPYVSLNSTSNSLLIWSLSSSFYLRYSTLLSDSLDLANEFPYRSSKFSGIFLKTIFTSSSEMHSSPSTSYTRNAISIFYSRLPMSSLRKNLTNSSWSILSSPFAFIYLTILSPISSGIFKYYLVFLQLK